MAGSVRFQHYEILRREDGSPFELGKGAMGITYKAFDTNLRTNVALKVINNTYLNSEIARQRFQREARAAAAIRHPNVATVYHLGNADDTYFYAMEFIDGETVESFMKREGSVRTSMALEIVSQVARALAAAQKQGLIHRDIKPSNLMLVWEDDREFTVKVIDFGLAKAASKEDAEDNATLTVGGFLGTPHFASPEQLEELEVDVRSDIYSLGVTLYYMLAGKTPFSGSLAQVMSQHLHREPPLDVVEDQPPEVVALLKRMMAKKPSERPQTPSELRKEVDACIEAIQSREEKGGPSKRVVQDDNLETAALGEERPSSAVEPAPGVVIAERFELLEEVSGADHGKLFRAKSLEDGTIVAVLVLDPALLVTAQAFTRLENDVVALHALRAPAIQRVLSLERAHHFSFVVMEWVEGQTLLDTLKNRHALDPTQTLQVLTPLGEALDALRGAGLSCPNLAAHRITLTGGMAPKFNALQLSDVSPGSPDATIVESPLAAMRAKRDAGGGSCSQLILGLAVLAYEMLGGVRGGSASFIPIPGVSELANAVLRSGLSGQATYASGADFVIALGRALNVSTKEASVSSEAVPPPLPTIVPMAESEPKQEPEEAEPRRLALAIFAVLLLVMLVIAGVLMLTRKPKPADILVETTPTPAPIEAPTPLATATATPIVAETTPTPPPATPAPSPETRLSGYEVAVQKATAFAENRDYENALLTLLDAMDQFPEETDSADKIEMVAAKAYSEAANLTQAQLLKMRDALRRAAEKANSTSAQMLLADGMRKINPEEAIHYYKMASDNGNSTASFLVGEMFASGKGVAQSFAEAIPYYRRAAEKGEPRAYYALGECYFTGKGVKQDFQLAASYLQTASGFGNPYAKNLLGALYRSGKGVGEPNFEYALQLFEEALRAGYIDAQANIGLMYLKGEGVGERNPGEAIRLWRNGAEQGSPGCMFLYAQALEEGLDSLKANRTEASSWYARAAKLGHPGARQWCQSRGVRF